MIECLEKFVRQYPIYAIKDGPREEGWNNWLPLPNKLDQRLN